MAHRPVLTAVLVSVGLAFAGAAVAAAAPPPPPTDVLVTKSPGTPFSQNKQNEPARRDRRQPPDVLAAGANDEIDMEACTPGDPTHLSLHPRRRRLRCLLLLRQRHHVDAADLHRADRPRLPGAAAPDRCTAHVGPIGTLPGYYEAGSSPTATRLWPSVHGRRRRPLLVGQRLAPLLREPHLELSAEGVEPPFKGFEAIAVSRTDDLAARGGWRREPRGRRRSSSRKQSSTTFSDKEQIWADNAASSPLLRQRLRLLGLLPQQQPRQRFSRRR